jgi:hypothetical protein
MVQTLAAVSSTTFNSFWCQLTNLRESPEAKIQFEKRFADFLPWVGLNVATVAVDDVITTLDDVIAFGISKNTHVFASGYDPLMVLRDNVRSIWMDNDPETKEWKISLLRGDLTMSGSFLFVLGPPPPTPYQRAVMHLLKSASKTRYCNNPDCPSPYFFGKRKSQKFCGEDCTVSIQREHRRRWWKKHGKAWRKQRKNKLGQTAKKRKAVSHDSNAKDR